MGGPDKDVELEAAARAIRDAGRDDGDQERSPEAAEAAAAAEAGDAAKGDTPGIASVHQANAAGVNPDK